MRVKAISRSTSTYVPQGTTSTPVPRNLNPALHPFEKAREYTRALNATKLDRLFAQPFLGQLGNGHVDGVYTFAVDPKVLNRVASGSGDGVVKLWEMTDRSEVYSVKAHDGVVKDMCYSDDGKLLTCASDQKIKLWDHPSKLEGKSTGDQIKPLMTYLGANSFNSITHHRYDQVFATASSSIGIWDISRSKPTSNLNWGSDSINVVRFNPTETSILASAGADRSLVFYDLRMSTPVTKLITTMSTNAISWNPVEPFNLAIGNEDHNAYIFDMRKLERALNVLKDHVAAVMDVCYSPTGQELVTGSYDRTLRIYSVREHGHSRDIYHTKRMQRIFSVAFTPDARYVLSGSDDGNIRLWRAKASERSHVRSTRERVKLEYDEALKKRYQHMPEIRRIARHRHLPKTIKKMSETKKVQLGSIKRKDENRRKNGELMSARTPERQKMVVKTIQ
ncbi:rRNA-processing protein sof1 [Orbilia oligospora]|uniref:DDB1- and CUL4-associated factor 13 n=1 Tax=Orbilia oligospora TaxID=2813651 RepID=A0A7C8U2Q6_ORBOL|nr:rRNA-processing protein sof1 [Orbilia oligospora]KAF3180997.1 rRNA-processing protein sof1 [Orbilia oligospora]KAF3234432.1 rRNA-processing protein sof1 [Orbilia oligospora]KAF3266633.1 rRNA-processing protein sof1 [Orbilia oligospora]KAF3285722.1 rRNA-processing protein sof1 [Orbilia oligospora]